MSDKSFQSQNFDQKNVAYTIICIALITLQYLIVVIDLRTLTAHKIKNKKLVHCKLPCYAQKKDSKYSDPGGHCNMSY